MHFTASIVIPVWNRLDALGECLATLAKHTPEAQFILVDLGSEQETERRLEQFADALEERVLLMHEPLNRGKTAAINRGIASAAADYIVVLSPMTTVTAGWLEPLCNILQNSPDVGIVCPDIRQNTIKSGATRTGGTIEIGQGSFYCQAMPRKLVTTIGPFAENQDGGEWCLADFSRRAWQAGYKTVRCHESLVYTANEQLFGSIERRARLTEESRRLYAERWEEPVFSCICLSDLAPWWPTILTGARQGDHYTIVVPAAAQRAIGQEGLPHQHANISIIPLPRLFPERRGKQLLTKLIAAQNGIIVVGDGSSIPLPDGITAIPITDLAARIANREQRLYGREIGKE